MRTALALPGVLLALTTSVGAQTLRVVPYVTGLAEPVGLVPHPTDPAVQFVIEKPGRIRIVDRGVLRPQPFLDITALVLNDGERGLLGLAVDPGYETSGRIWVNYTRQPDGATVVARYTRSAGDTWRAEPLSRHDLRFESSVHAIEQPASNHNGGRIFFGDDRQLYIAMGDGGGGNDPHRTAQDPGRLLGKILRIDVHVPDVTAASSDQLADATRGYRIPPDNPFVSGWPVAARAEIWAFGVRNPWRVTPDPVRLGGTGGLFIADVGQSAFEEVSYEPPARGGRNYGWPLREGTRFNTEAPAGVTPAVLPLVSPVFEYPRNIGVSITGGHRYRGGLLGPAMRGRYVFGDLGNRLYSVAIAIDPGTGEAGASDFREHTGELGGLSGTLVSIDADLDGELFLVMLSGTILRLTTSDDADGNGLPDAWEQQFGLTALGPELGGPLGDPNGDGVINAEALRRGLHPTGQPVGYFAEGATGFFDVRVSVLNDSQTPTTAVVHFQTADARESTRTLPIGAERIAVVDAATGGQPMLGSAEFATRILADRPLTSARLMTWQPAGSMYGSHSEHGVTAPGLTWYFAEGATTSFEVFLLLQNPSIEDAHVRVDYFVHGAGLIPLEYDVPAGTRRTIWVNHEAGLGWAEFGARVSSTNGVPIFAERAMYTRGGVQYPAGTAAAGEPSPATRWFFAEGSTGDYFDTFIAVANPAPDPLPITARVYLADGSTSGAPLTFSQVVAPNARATIWLDTITTDEGVSLANQNGVSVEVEGTHPFVAERAMWWAGLPTQWYEGHAAAGFSEPPRAQWRLAGGVVHVPPAGLESSSETYVLVANVGATVADVRVRVFFTDRDPIEIPLPIAPFSRETLPLSPALIAAGVPEGVHDIGIRVDGLNGAELYVEQAVYSTPPGGPHWAAGAAHRATP